VGLDVEHGQFTDFGLRLGRLVAVDAGSGELEANYVRTFADVGRGELLLYEDAYRRLSVAVCHGNAAERLGLSVDDQLRIRP
jgi:S-adenosylmethionine hydrolase